MREREGECQVDIVDGDNAAEIAGGQRGLMMMLLASERVNERANRASCSWTGTPLYSPLHPLPPIRPPLPLSPPLKPRRSFATSHFLSSATLALSVILELRYSDIACGVVPAARSRGIFTREISHHRPLSPLNENVSPLMEYDP